MIHPQVSEDPILEIGDLTASPGCRGDFLIGQLRKEGWIALGQTPNWAETLRRMRFYTRAYEARALVSRDGLRFRLFDETRVWLDADRPWMPLNDDEVRRSVPTSPGLYVVRAVTPLFVGDTDSLRDRLLYHLRTPWACAEARDGHLEVCFEEVQSARARSIRTRDLIDWWLPPCNQTM